MFDYLPGYSVNWSLIFSLLHVQYARCKMQDLLPQTGSQGKDLQRTQFYNGKGLPREKGHFINGN